MIWLKEFLKLNKILAALLLFHIAIAFYFYLRIRGLFITASPMGVWLNIISMNTFYFSIFEKPLYITGCALAILQFYPEVEKRRFRISCHLPANEYITLAKMIFFAIAAISVFGLIDALSVLLVSAGYFPYEIFSETPIIIFYWYINALLFYAVAAVLTLEPSWKAKVRLFLILAAFYKLVDVSIYNSPKVYIIYLIIIAALFVSTIFYPAERFRRGV
ncbi:MAG: hypothetical protein LBP51_00730 [Deferribacteraceae bacterium]|jgi:hypothetical protein|nr:hypothetical protein [Deferribacteraceae bacterium]